MASSKITSFCLLFLGCIATVGASVEDIFHETDQKIVLETRRYCFEHYPDAFNPAIHEFNNRIVLTFRYSPDLINQSWISYIGIVELDKSLNPIGEPQLLATRHKRSKTPSQAEDARIFSYKGKVFLIYNDNVDQIFFDYAKRRDMFIAELISTETGFQLSTPLKLFHHVDYHRLYHQKNWIPFEWNNSLYFSYNLHPHEVIAGGLKTGECFTAHTTKTHLDWIYGHPRGSTPPVLVNGEYLAFFHSSSKTKSPASYNWKLWHYFMGAYTFSAEPPFKITKATNKPLMHPDFYTPSYREKRVIFPGGFIVLGPNIYVAYGKDDCEIWVAKLDKDELMKALHPVH